MIKGGRGSIRGARNRTRKLLSTVPNPHMDENARLLNELRQRTTDLTKRTADLTEALEQQTATSEVLQVISSSPDDLQPVFATMLEKAVRLCDATFGNIYRWDGELSNLVASHNTPPALVEARRRLRIHFVPKDLVGQAIANKKAVHIADLAEHQECLREVGCAFGEFCSAAAPTCIFLCFTRRPATSLGGVSRGVQDRVRER